MTKETPIEWAATRLTDGRIVKGGGFNMWKCCAQVAPGCLRCWAMVAYLAKNPGSDDWREGGARPPVKNWRKLLASIERAGHKDGVRRRVFTCSDTDIFDKSPMCERPRNEFLYEILPRMKKIDWLFLTKRIPNAKRMLPPDWLTGNWPPEVWMGISVAVQEDVEIGVPHLLALPAPIKWLSCEPLLEPLNLRPYLGPNRINWVVVGGEGSDIRNPPRPCELDWMRDIQEQCHEAGVAFFCKQKGTILAKAMRLRHPHGARMEEWPRWCDYLKEREWPL
jgi:protein gp37